jgi:hypothetical protein
MGKGLALGEGGDADGGEGHGERYARDAEEERVAVLAGLADEAVEEFERDDFEEPVAVVGVGGLGVRRVVKRARGREGAGLTWRGGGFG